MIEVTGKYEKVNAATKAAVSAKEASKYAFDDAFDKAVEFGWEMGVVDERNRTLEVIDALTNKLLDSEEDAKMTLDILKKLLLQSE